MIINIHNNVRRNKAKRFHRQSKLTSFDYINYVILGIMSIITIYPFWYVLVVSFSSQQGYYNDMYHIIPKSFSLETYKYVLANKYIFRAFGISSIVTIAGLALSMVLTSLGAYALSKKDLKGRNIFFTLIILTMFLNGGLVPWYMTINYMGLGKNILAFFVPTAVNTFNLILLKNYFQAIPESLIESAEIDGANDLQILFKIAIPVSIPIMVTIALFYAVFFWNDWFAAMLFAKDQNMYPLPLLLRNMIMSSQNYMSVGFSRQLPDMVKAAVIIVSITPIMLIYPFIQKFFIKGIMLGSVKE